MYAPMKRIAILFAVSQEIAPLSKRLESRQPGPATLRAHRTVSGTIGSVELLLAVTGVGARRAEQAARAVVEAWRPDLLMMAGVAGGLAPDLRVGELITANRVLTPAGEKRPSLVPVGTGVTLRRGALLSADRILVTVEEKRKAYAAALGGDSMTRSVADGAPLAVEMETAGVIATAETLGVPWAAVRALSDTAAEALPLDFNRLRSADGDLPTSRVALAAITHPTAIPGLIRLGKNTSLAAEALGEFLAAWVKGVAADTEFERPCEEENEAHCSNRGPSPGRMLD